MTELIQVITPTPAQALGCDRCNDQQKARSIAAGLSLSTLRYARIFSPNCFSNFFSFGAITNWQ
jgi:hypothetical protein